MSTKTITPNVGNVSGVNTPLIPFDCIFDLDYGLLRLIRCKYFDTDIFSKEFFDDSVVGILNKLYYRDHQNPILMTLNSQNVEVAQSLYDDFVKKEYNEIVRLSMSTEIFNLVQIFHRSGEVRPTILYDSDFELEFMKNIPCLANVSKVNIGEVSKNFDFYQQFFFKDIDNIYLERLKEDVFGRSAYIGGYKYCCDEEGQIILNMNTGILHANRNIIFKIDIYNTSKLKGALNDV